MMEETVVVAHKIDFDMLKMINDIETVERIRGTYAGGGMAYHRSGISMTPTQQPCP